MASKHFTINPKRLRIALAIAIPIGLGLGAAISHATWEPPTIPLAQRSTVAPGHRSTTSPEHGQLQ